MRHNRSQRYRLLAEHLAEPVVLLAFLFLVLVAAILQRVTSAVYGDPQAGVRLEEIQLYLLMLVVLWPVFILEAVVQLLALEKEPRDARRVCQALLTSLCPPLRMAARSPAMGDRLWLPVLGWQEVNEQLRRRLERAFSIPMLVIALMILPVLVIEYGWSDQVLQNGRLALLLDLCTGVIWLAFATEFILLASIAENKLAYCRQHWIDLAIILLPLVSILRCVRVARLGRLARLKQLSALGRVYRLRGLAFRAYRGIILLDLFDRLSRRSAEKRLEHLRADLASKEAQVQELRQQIAALEVRIRGRTAPRAWRARGNG